MTPRQRFFVLEYLIDLDPRQAAIRAGYSPRSARSQGLALMRRTDLAAAIRKEMDERARRTGITAERVLEEYARVVLAITYFFADEGQRPDSLAGSLELLPAPGAAIALLSEFAGEGAKDIAATGMEGHKVLQSLARLFGLNFIEPEPGVVHRA